MRFAVAVLALLAGSATPRPAHAQHRDQSIAAMWMDLSPPAPGDQPRVVVLVPDAASMRGPEGASTEWLVVAGVVGGAVGMVGGLATGALLDGPADPECIDFCFGPGVILGPLIGEVVGVSLGVHLANGSRGRIVPGVLTSAGLLAGGLAVGLAVPPLLFVVPVGQLAGVIRMERRTARIRASRDP